MSENKKYYWLKLMNDFFTQPRIKKLRRIAGGDTYTIIYLKLQLLSLKNNGVLIFEGIEDTVIEELALTIDEDIDNVNVTFQFLLKQGLIEQLDDESYLMAETQYLIGSETASANRVRKHRQKQKTLQCNNYVTGSKQIVTNCNTEIDIEKDKDKKKEKDINNIHILSSKNDDDILEEEFEKLWGMYPKKVGKPKALQKYKKYRTSKKEDYCSYEEVLKGLEKYLKYIEQNSWYSPKDGSTWFNNQGWTDEYEIKEERYESEFTLHYSEKNDEINNDINYEKKLNELISQMKEERV